MKKITSVLMAGLLAAMTLASCNSGDNSSSAASAESSAASAAESSAAESSAEESSAETTADLSGTVSMSGSTSMEIVAKALGEAFTAVYPDVTVDVQLGGSSTGIQNALEGVSDIGNVSRDLAEDETGLTPHEIALDGIGIAVNPENPVENLTLEQIAGIYTGEITNWSEVGGEDLEIYVVGREAGSGTRDAFESIVGVEDVAAYDSEQTSTGSAKTTVATTPGAIGYVSFDSIDDTVKTVTVNDVAISLETIQDGSYVLQRPFLMVTKEGAELSEAAQAFLDYTLSDEGQAVCEQVGLVPVK